MHFREIFGSLQFVDESGDEEEWVSVLDCVLVEILIILTRPQSTVLLLNKEEGRGLGGLISPDLRCSSMNALYALVSLGFMG